jgi:transposase
MKIASEEIRTIVVKAYLAGTASRQKLSEIFGYTPASISNWVREYKRENRLAPHPPGHRKAVFADAELTQLADLLGKKVDLTLAEIREQFGKSCSLVAIYKTVAKIGFVFKKTLRASEQEREDIICQREKWREFQTEVEPCGLVFLDESGVKTNMTRLYGRSRKGNRCYDKTPDGRWETVTVLSAIRLDGETESIMFEGAVDRKMFEAYIEQILGPSLRAGDIVVMDNLGPHKSQVAQKFVESQSARYLFLPAYSPDFNPIENMWSKVKQILRTIKARTQEELFEAVAKALNMVTAEDAQGWFESCGYGKSQS